MPLGGYILRKRTGWMLRIGKRSWFIIFGPLFSVPRTSPIAERSVGKKFLVPGKSNPPRMGFVLKDRHVDAILALIMSALVFLVGLAWNSVIDMLIKMYGNGDSLELALFYAILVTVLAFALGDYIINKLKVDCGDSSHIHRLVRFVAQEREVSLSENAAG